MSSFVEAGLSWRVAVDRKEARIRIDNGNDSIVEKNLSNTTTQRIVKGIAAYGGVGAAALQDLSGTIIYPHKNQVGSTVRHTDSTQALANYYEYDGWGQPFLAVERTGTAQQYRYSGKELDPDFIAFNSVNRRYHIPARFYIPFRGTFGQIDPSTRRRSEVQVLYGPPSFHGRPTPVKRCQSHFCQGLRRPACLCPIGRCAAPSGEDQAHDQEL